MFIVTHLAIEDDDVRIVGKPTNDREVAAAAIAADIKDMEYDDLVSLGGEMECCGGLIIYQIHEVK